MLSCHTFLGCVEMLEHPVTADAVRFPTDIFHPHQLRPVHQDHLDYQVHQVYQEHQVVLVLLVTLVPMVLLV